MAGGSATLTNDGSPACRWLIKTPHPMSLKRRRHPASPGRLFWLDQEHMMPTGLVTATDLLGLQAWNSPHHASPGPVYSGPIFSLICVLRDCTRLADSFPCPLDARTRRRLHFHHGRPQEGSRLLLRCGHVCGHGMPPPDSQNCLRALSAETSQLLLRQDADRNSLVPHKEYPFESDADACRPRQREA